MSFRFRRSLSLMRGMRLNLSKGGISFSVGARGASVTVNKSGVYVNFGAPGTGVSYRKPLVRFPRRNSRS